MKIYFLADDLSGALDAAAAFHHAGRRVRVVLSVAEWTAADENEVVGVTTETRNAPPAVAAAAVERVLARGRAQGARLVYKKIDSTLRGPVAAELAALAAALPEAT
ncbi:MAG: four-carbon acid sugar kinase family protein, partial [Verrucomicrobia bacterium]|nr:four-carbon acid sugar kinase family protein [Verrucomicrobiota bacterium]